jgi:hypothetical protein
MFKLRYQRFESNSNQLEELNNPEGSGSSTSNHKPESFVALSNFVNQEMEKFIINGNYYKDVGILNLNTADIPTESQLLDKSKEPDGTWVPPTAGTTHVLVEGVKDPITLPNEYDPKYSVDKDPTFSKYNTDTARKLMEIKNKYPNKSIKYLKYEGKSDGQTLPVSSSNIPSIPSVETPATTQAPVSPTQTSTIPETSNQSQQSQTPETRVQTPVNPSASPNSRG